jgi:hypothetical protein
MGVSLRRGREATIFFAKEEKEKSGREPSYGQHPDDCETDVK